MFVLDDSHYKIVQRQLVHWKHFQLWPSKISYKRRLLESCGFQLTAKSNQAIIGFGFAMV